jgi:hypothetical protein
VQHFTEFKASRIIATDGILIPTGEFTNAEGTPADFHKPKSLGLAIQDTKSGQFCGTGILVSCLSLKNAYTLLQVVLGLITAGFTMNPKVKTQNFLSGAITLVLGSST